MKKPRRFVAMTGRDTIEVLGVKVHKLTLSDAIAHLAALAKDTRPHMVITLNTEMVMLAQRDPAFRVVLNSASLLIPDTVGLLWASKVLGVSLPERIPGADLVEHFAKYASAGTIRFYFLGAAPGIAEQAASILRRRYPGFTTVGSFSGSPHPRDESEICDRIRAVSPDVLLVAYKVPEQEFWISRNLMRLNVPVVINTGGTFDFIVGLTRRAPAWVRASGLEWLFRLLCQPWRWRRMLALPRFVAAILRERIRNSTGIARPRGSFEENKVAL
jgi:N-acetylglucosaminyldiphosphoundecaprenol N-acetyl-beta-D-mannosaminyltransferase